MCSLELAEDFKEAVFRLGFKKEWLFGIMFARAEIVSVAVVGVMRDSRLEAEWSGCKSVIARLVSRVEVSVRGRLGAGSHSIFVWSSSSFASRWVSYSF